MIDIDVDERRLRRTREQIERRVLRAQRAAVSEVTREAERALETATAGAGLGKLSKAWRSQVYPRTGLAKEPVGVVFGNGGQRTTGALTSHGVGGRIAPKGGRALAIPLPAARRGMRKTLSPEEWQAATGIRLRLVVRRGKPPLLVADVTRSGRGRFRAASERAIGRGRNATAAIFVLVPAVDARAKFSVRQVLAGYPVKLSASFKQKLEAMD